MRITFDIDDRYFRRRLRQLDEDSERAIEGAFGFQAARSTAWMKANAPWTDRTTAARSGLHAVHSRNRGRFELVLAHAVSYGIWLEVANSGNYQIILPALRQASRELQELLDHIWSRI
jgi:hypothetical protein